MIVFFLNMTYNIWYSLLELQNYFCANRAEFFMRHYELIKVTDVATKVIYIQLNECVGDIST